MPTPRRYDNRAQQQAAYRQRLAHARTQEQRSKGLPPLPPIATMPGTRRWEAMTQQAVLLLQTVQEEMQDYCDERSEVWQESERGDDMTERLRAVEDAVTAIEAIVT